MLVSLYMLKINKFLLFVVGFLSGIFVGKCVISGEFGKILGVFGIFLMSLGFRIPTPGVIYLRRILIFLIAVLFGMFRFFVSFEDGAEHIRFLEGDLIVRGEIAAEVDVRSDKVKYTVDVFAVYEDDEWKDSYGRLLVNGKRYPVYEYGDFIEIRGKIETPEKIDGFDYDNYLARYGIYSVMYRAGISKIEERLDGDEGWIEKWKKNSLKKIFVFKNKFERELAEIYPEPHNSFMAGLILGSRRGIPDDLMENFNTTGLTHIIAISGYNITLVIVITSSLLGFLSRKKKVIFSVIFIIVFVILVGASSAVVRAAVMGGISLFALWFGRKYDVGVGLMWAAFLMNLWNPKILVYDIGFQLSFLATCGVIYVAPRIERYFGFLPSCIGVRESVLMTISAQVLALPVIVLNFERLSLVSPVANLLVLPLIPFAMLVGFLATVVSFISGFLGQILGVFGYLILELIIFVVNVLSKGPFASLEIEWFSWWLAVGYYYWVGKKLMQPS